jgi:hypothetical protein
MAGYLRCTKRFVSRYNVTTEDIFKWTWAMKKEFVSTMDDKLQLRHAQDAVS